VFSSDTSEDDEIDENQSNIQDMGDDSNNEKKQGIIFSADGADAMNNQMFGKTITGLGSIMEEEGVDKTGAEAVVPSTVAKAKKISVLIPPSQPNCKSLQARNVI
tara:strand:+ start:73 stop:387 length:315 start_codon:yes stop_codon:yes gene_type:complete